MGMNLAEVMKGIAVFLFGNLFYYISWFIFKGLLSFATTEEVYLGTISWVVFVFMYAITCAIYPMYAIMVGYKGQGETKIKHVILANVFWLVGTVTCLLVFYIVDGLLTALSNAALITEVGAVTADVNIIVILGWIGVLIVYAMYMLVLPLNNMLQAFDVEVEAK